MCLFTCSEQNFFVVIFYYSLVALLHQLNNSAEGKSGDLFNEEIAIMEDGFLGASCNGISYPARSKGDNPCTHVNHLRRMRRRWINI